MGLSIMERDIKPDELGKFDEAFMTNAMIEVMPMVAVRNENDKEIIIGTGKPGIVTRKLMRAYKEKVELETA
jgi:branched-subunit amino acid aminotransferase/4-amino-4-deoxychorismate lyase